MVNNNCQAINSYQGDIVNYLCHDQAGMHTDAQFLIEKLQLEPHEEGGYFRVTYESKQQIEIPGYNGK